MTPTTRDGSELMIFPSRWKMALLALGSLAFVLLGASLWRVSGSPGGGVLRAAVAADWLLFGYGFLFAAGRLLRPRPSVVLDDRGLTDNASAAGAGLVRWDEITGVGMVEMGFSRYLTVEVRDPEAVLARQPAVKRWVMAANRGLVSSPVTIPGTLPIPLDELAGMIVARLEDRGREVNV